jgi:hypothetical protein
MGPRHVEEIRQKLMRKQEIESGLPLLEDELLKTEAKLAQCREEEKKLLAEIAKGREGRLRLVQELQALGIETDGLTMEELQQAKDSFESSVAANDEIGECQMPFPPPFRRKAILTGCRLHCTPRKRGPGRGFHASSQ